MNERKCYRVLLAAMLFIGVALQAPAKEQEILRVLSYNIHMWQIKVDALAKIIKAADADIVGLNEAWDAERNNELAKQLGYRRVWNSENWAIEADCAREVIEPSSPSRLN